MKIHYSRAWSGWVAQAMVRGELRTVVNRISREGAINRLIEIIYGQGNEKQTI